MRIPIYQIDAFASEVFAGNPAAVCPLEEWLPDGALQAIAAENNLSETAFIIRRDAGQYDLRWFTPQVEVDLCGHATLASAFAVLTWLEPDLDSVTFDSRSGRLVVTREGELLSMDFPARAGAPADPPANLIEGLGRQPAEVLLSRDWLVVYDSEQTVRAIEPRFDLLARVEGLGIIVTAPGEEADFVSRFFAPGAGIPEDPVTGSAHCTLIPYWAKRLRKAKLRALQVSRRGGELFCEDRGDRVSIAGRATRYLEGFIYVG